MKKFVVLAGAIPVFNNKILITQRSFKSKFMPGNWGLPCGKIDFGEDLEKAVIRELYEETGLKGEIKKIIGTSKFVGEKNGIQIHNVQINFLITLNDDNVILNDESENYKWIDTGNYKSSIIDDFNKNVISQAFN